jgi:beta-N-acetylhexosaminidase
VRVEGPARVIELLAEPNVAAGPHDHSLAHLLDTADDGRLVIVLRDAHRHERERAEAERLLEAHEDAIVVDTGLPSWRPPAARAYIATQGAGRVNLAAAAERLHGVG